MPKALVLEKALELSLRDIDLDMNMDADDVRVRVEVVGICGSDVHYYQHGRIGPFTVTSPMVLGHEASGTIIAKGRNVKNLEIGDRVCMEPGIPDFSSRTSRIGLYNLDPSLTFWATPPIHGCLTPEIVHPATLTYRLPDDVSSAEGALVEPLAVGVQAVTKANVKPGDTALVLGAGPIGLLTALAALAGGCATVFVFDPVEEKLSSTYHYKGIVPLLPQDGSLVDQVSRLTSRWGTDAVFECSGAAGAFSEVATLLRPGGTLVCVGMPVDPVSIDIVSLQLKEIRVETVFRYANVYPKAISMISSSKLDLTPIISRTYDFNDSIAAFERAAEAHPTDIKLQIRVA